MLTHLLHLCGSQHQTVLRHLSNTLASDASKAQRSIDEQLLELQFDEILSLTRTLFVHMLRLLRAARVWLSQLT